jgi:uncharacterized membrane protein
MVKLNEHSKIWAFVGVFFSILGFFAVLLFQKEDEYAMYYAKLGLSLFLFALLISVLAWVPVVGFFIDVGGSIILIGVWIVCIVNSLSGKKKRVPVISDLADKF